MKYIQESFARDLHSDLSLHFESTPEVQLSLSGTGVNWRCTAKNSERGCEINCFDAHFNGCNAEYLSSFSENGQIIVWGRTDSKADTIAAASNWLRGNSLGDLEIRFEFIDNQKRKLLNIVQALTERFPKIREESSRELKRLICDGCEFWFVQRDRACKLSYYGKNKFADAKFYWDECELFRFQAENIEKLAAVLVAWLCDSRMPSKMRKDFPWLEIGELADYYENGRPIEGEFFMSWNSIESFYARYKYPFTEQVLKMVGEMRRRGYEKRLRAGQSMSSLVLSRSRRHGLRQNQPRIIFNFKESGMEINARFENEENIQISQIAFSTQVDVLLQRLAGTVVD